MPVNKARMLPTCPIISYRVDPNNTDIKTSLALGQIDLLEQAELGQGH